MIKKSIMVLVLALFVVGTTSTAFAGNVSGEVTKVKGNKVTVKVSKAQAKKIDVGDTIELTVTGKAANEAPAAGNDMLTGC